MNQHLNPAKVHGPLGAYTHTVKIPSDAEWLVVSGQVGIDAAGRVAVGAGKQTERALRNVLACLRANGMTKRHLVKFTIYLTDARFIEEYRGARRKVIGDDTLPASTLVITQGLASPDILVEVEAWAAKS